MPGDVFDQTFHQVFIVRRALPVNSTNPSGEKPRAANTQCSADTCGHPQQHVAIVQVSLGKINGIPANRGARLARSLASEGNLERTLQVRKP